MKIKTDDYENIILDFGGVILDLDMSLTIKKFEELTLKKVDIFNDLTLKNILDIFETGRISAEEFRKELCEYLQLKINDEEFDMVWNKLLLEIPSERVLLIKKLSEKKKIYLLSNTNEIHEKSFSKDYEKKFNGKLADLFEKVFYSYEIGLRKPDIGIFRYVLDDLKANPAKTLFIDDNFENCEAAKKLGISSYFLDLSKETLVDLFN